MCVCGYVNNKFNKLDFLSFSSIPTQDVYSCWKSVSSEFYCVCTKKKNKYDTCTHRACPMWDASYTVGPQLYQRTAFPFFGTNTSFFRVKLLNNFRRGVADASPCDHAGWVRLAAAIGDWPSTEKTRRPNASTRPKGRMAGKTFAPVSYTPSGKRPPRRFRKHAGAEHNCRSTTILTWTEASYADETPDTFGVDSKPPQLGFEPFELFMFTSEKRADFIIIESHAKPSTHDNNVAPSRYHRPPRA